MIKCANVIVGYSYFNYGIFRANTKQYGINDVMM